MATLLEKAKRVVVKNKRTRSEFNPEMLELAMAYFKHEVTETQIAQVLETTAPSAAAKIKSVLAVAVREGQLVHKK